MVWLYTGTPGSGKSLHAARDIVSRAQRGGGLICNFPLDLSMFKVRANVEYWDNSEMTVQGFYNYAYEHHVIGKENQTLVVIDEAQILFNCREFNNKSRNAWIEMFTQHRKLGYNFIIICPNDRMLDRQIRGIIEYEVRHRKANNYGMGGFFLNLTMIKWFLAIEYWYGMKGDDAKVGISIFPYTKKYNKIYNSYALFKRPSEERTGTDGGGDPQSGGDSTSAPRRSVIVS